MVDYDEMAVLDGNRNAPAIRNVPEIGWMDSETRAPDISLAHDQKVDLWGLCKMMTELKGKYGNVWLTLWLLERNGCMLIPIYLMIC